MDSIFYQWNFSPGNLIFLFVLCAFYAYASRFHFSGKTTYFFIALTLIVICTSSPLHHLGMQYLFSAHMTSHVILILIAGPLLAASITGNNRYQRKLHKLSLFLKKYPLTGWIAGVGMMWFWHIPAIFHAMMPMKGMQSSLGMQIIGLVHLVTLLGAGILFSWPLINPYKECRIASLKAVAYLSSACVFCSLLGLMITFAPSGTYTSYIMSEPGGFLSLIRNNWQISSAMDQQIAGLIMWVPCCFIYLSASMIILIKWFGIQDSVNRAEPEKLVMQME